MPIRRSTFLSRYRWRTVFSGLATSGLVAVLVVPPILSSPAKPVITDATVQTASSHALSSRGAGQPVPHVNWSAVRKNRGFARTCSANDPRGCLVLSGSGPTVLVVGDSEARALAPTLLAIAKTENWNLYVNVISGCPWQTGITITRQPRSGRIHCARHRAGWYAQALPRIRPDVIIADQRAWETGDTADSIQAKPKPRNGETLKKLTARTITETVSAFRASGARVVIMRSLISAGSWDPLSCLSKAKSTSQCVVKVPLKWPVSDAVYRTLAARDSGVAVVNLNGLLCPQAPLCQPILHGKVVWRDAEHPTSTILLADKAAIRQKLDGTGFFGS